MNNQNLKDFIEEHNIRSRTVDYFWKAFNNYRKEHPNEFEEVFFDFDRQKLKLNYKKISLVIREWETFDVEYNQYQELIEAYLDIEYNNEDIGWYLVLYDFEGKAFDDVFWGSN